MDFPVGDGVSCLVTNAMKIKKASENRGFRWLLRLGLNQRPSDIRFWLAAVGLFATEIENTPALLVLQIGVSRQFFSMHLVFRRASAVGKNIG